ncbi:MAG TPA: hypothetical protein VIY72_13165 [Acidimicrobiales bacterium]
MTPPGSAATLSVHLLGVPAATLRFAQDQHDALLRELELITMGGDGGEADVATLRSQLVDLRAIFTTFRPMVDHQMGERGAGSPDPTLDLTLVLPADLADRADEGNELFDRLEARCGGQLLLARPPALASGFRTWFLSQVSCQLRGGATVSWPTWWAEHGDGSEPVPG